MLSHFRDGNTFFGPFPIKNLNVAAARPFCFAISSPTLRYSFRPLVMDAEFADYRIINVSLTFYERTAGFDL